MSDVISIDLLHIPIHHLLVNASQGNGIVGGAEVDSDFDACPDPDLDPSLEEVIWMELLSLSPPSLDWGGRTTMA